MSGDYFDPNSELFRPLTMNEVLEITGRSRRTIERWIQTRRLTPFEEKNRRRVVFNEDQVVEAEKATRDAMLRGRTPRSPSAGTGVDAGQILDA